MGGRRVGSGSDLGGLGQMGLKFRSEFGSNGCRVSWSSGGGGEVVAVAVVLG